LGVGMRRWRVGVTRWTDWSNRCMHEVFLQGLVLYPEIYCNVNYRDIFGTLRDTKIEPCTTLVQQDDCLVLINLPHIA
jgi:hypothetical protein